jgi:heat shock protein HtpX
LHNDIESVCKTAGIPKPKVYIVPLKIANAFATGRNPKHAAVAVTEGILDKLNREELKGVLAHEISHVKNRDILIATIAATIAGVISYIAMMARYAAMFGGGDRDREGNALGLVGLLIAAIVAPIAALLIQLAISRTREYSADESGAMLLKNGLPLANALLKLEESAKTNPLRKGNTATSHLFIVNPFSAQGFVKLFMTHPPISERVARLRKLKF